LAEAVLPALRRSPCCVSLSGGRGSSALLALATSVARHHGLADPVPVSVRFPAHPGADEREWQDLVIDHLGLRGRQVLEFDEELDVLGDIATAGLVAHGQLWPPSSHLYVPALDCARGGSLLTSIDHGQLLEWWRWARAQAVLHGRSRPVPRDVVRVGFALAPARLRREVIVRRWASHLPWVRPSALDTVIRFRVRDDSPLEPRRWDRRIAWLRSVRNITLHVHSVNALGAARDVEVHHPLLDPAVLSTLAQSGGPVGLERPWQELYADLLPAATLARRPTRHEMGPVLWGRRARAFAERWRGAGLDLELVDPDRLRTIWRGEHPWLGAATLAQAAWLASEGQDG
jgi:asparagine synthase (glutamine-hydrolysing)